MTEHFPNVGKAMDIRIHEAQRPQIGWIVKRLSQNTLKLTRVKEKENNLKMAIKRQLYHTHRHPHKTNSGDSLN